MFELLFLSACILIYLVSFIYRRISILASFIVLGVAFLVKVNLFFAIGVLAILTLMRLKKSGVKEEI